jgi:hypothetical protein
VHPLSLVLETGNTDLVPDEDDRPRDKSGGADAGWPDAGRPDDLWAHAKAPDDLRELARDVAAYHREQRTARRHERFGWLGFGATSAPLTLTVVALAIVAIAATLLTLMGPRPSGPPPAQQLLTTSVADGAVGGLLPDVLLSDANGTTVPVRGLRPAALAVLPPGCACGDLVREAATSAAAIDIPLYAVVPAGQTADADALSGQLKPTAILNDTTGEIEAAVSPRSLTYVLVNRDGSIFKKYPGATSADARTLSGYLKTMLGTTG